METININISNKILIFITIFLLAIGAYLYYPQVDCEEQVEYFLEKRDVILSNFSAQQSIRYNIEVFKQAADTTQDVLDFLEENQQCIDYKDENIYKETYWINGLLSLNEKIAKAGG